MTIRFYMTKGIGVLDIHVVYEIALRTDDRMGSHWLGKMGILHLAMALEDLSIYTNCIMVTDRIRLDIHIGIQAMTWSCWHIGIEQINLHCSHYFSHSQDFSPKPLCNHVPVDRCSTLFQKGPARRTSPRHTLQLTTPTHNLNSSHLSNLTFRSFVNHARTRKPVHVLQPYTKP